MTEFHIEAAKLSLKKMFARGSFDICAIDAILKMTGGVPTSEDYSALRLMHCVDFKEMSQSMILMFPGILKRVLESPSMEIEIKFKTHDRLAG